MEEFINTILRAIFEFDVGSEDLASSMIFSQKEVAFVGQIWDILRIVAVAATIVYFMLEANRVWALEARDLNIKGFMAPFLKLVIALFVIKYSGYLVSLALNFSNSIVGQVSKIKIGNSGIDQSFSSPVWLCGGLCRSGNGGPREARVLGSDFCRNHRNPLLAGIVDHQTCLPVQDPGLEV